MERRAEVKFCFHGIAQRPYQEYAILSDMLLNKRLIQVLVSVVCLLVYIVFEILYLLEDPNVLVYAYVAVLVQPQMATLPHAAARSLLLVGWGRNLKSKGEKNLYVKIKKLNKSRTDKQSQTGNSVTTSHKQATVQPSP